MTTADIVRHRPPGWLVVLALIAIGVELGIHHMPCSGLFIIAAVLVAASHD